MQFLIGEYINPISGEHIYELLYDTDHRFINEKIFLLTFNGIKVFCRVIPLKKYKQNPYPAGFGPMNHQALELKNLLDSETIKLIQLAIGQYRIDEKR